MICMNVIKVIDIIEEIKKEELVFSIYKKELDDENLKPHIREYYCDKYICSQTYLNHLYSEYFRLTSVFMSKFSNEEWEKLK